MAIPFKDLSRDRLAESAGYLRFIEGRNGERFGALFLMDEWGEPVEFTHARIKAPSSFLWRPDDLRTHCIRSLCVAMFDACPRSPLFMLCLADEVGPHVFSENIRLQIPVGRVARSDLPVTVSPHESSEPETRSEAGTEFSVYWTQAPEPGSEARRLFDAVVGRGMLFEPFQRMEAGLREVYADGAV